MSELRKKVYQKAPCQEIEGLVIKPHSVAADTAKKKRWQYLHSEYAASMENLKLLELIDSLNHRCIPSNSTNAKCQLSSSAASPSSILPTAQFKLVKEKKKKRIQT